MAFVVSGILHAAALISLPGLGMTGFAGLISIKSLSATLFQDEPAKPYERGKVQKYKGLYSPSDLSKGVNKRLEETIEKDEEEPEGIATAQQVPLEAGVEKKAQPEDPTKEGDRKQVAKLSGLLPEAARTPKTGRTTHIINFKREKFSYDIYWLGIYVGGAIVEAVNEGDIIRITSQVHSAPVISAFYRVEDYAESRVKDGRPFNFRIRQREGKYRSDKETIFDAGSGKITYYDYLKGIKDEHVVTDNVFWDVISGFYYLRTKELEPEKTVFVDIFDSNKMLNAEVNVLGLGRVKMPEKGEIDAIIIRPILKSNGLFQHKGDIRVWLSKDENKMPVRVETSVPIGKVTAELRQIETEK